LGNKRAFSAGGDPPAASFLGPKAITEGGKKGEKLKRGKGGVIQKKGVLEQRKKNK